MPDMAINDIVIGKRHRKDMGNLRSLADSIEKHGLLQGVVVNSRNELIAGYRRLEAVRLLGWESVPVNVVERLDDLLLALTAERDENIERKDFLPSESVDMGRSIADVARAEAAKRAEEGRREGGKKAGRGRPSGRASEDNGQDRLTENLHQPNVSENREKRTTRTRVADSVGMSAPTLDKAAAVVDAAEADPERYKPILDEMDRTGKVDTAFRKVQKLEALGDIPTELVRYDRTVDEDLVELFSTIRKRLLGITSRYGEPDVFAANIPHGKCSHVLDNLETVLEPLRRLEKELRKCQKQRDQ